MDKVTAVVCTRNRGEILSQCLQSLAMQTVKPNMIWVYDDSDKHVDLRNVEPYRQLLTMLLQMGIPYAVVYGNGSGQVTGHKLSLRECKTEYIWRVDDDDIPEPSCLEKLLDVIDKDPKIGAVGGLVLDVTHHSPSKMASNDIRDIYLGLNVQWFRHEGLPYEVDHLYSSFIFRRDGEDYYPSNLSRIGHREETIMTYRMKRAGYKIMVQPSAITWHLKSEKGGIRDGYREMWDKDEVVFAEMLRDWNINPRKHKIITLDNGLGDHYAFKSVLKELIDRYGDNLVLACCYPDVFRDFGVKIISIGEAYGGNHKNGIYRYMVENNWTGEKGNMIDAYRKAYCS